MKVGYLLLALTAAALAGEPERVIVTLGALEAEFTPAGLDVLWWRDRHVFGDAHDDRRPVTGPELLRPGWRSAVALTESEPIELEERPGVVTVRLAGRFEELAGGPGRWAWRQTWTLDSDGRLSLEWSVVEEAPPHTPVWLHRWAFAGNRYELFVTPPTADTKPPGKPIPIERADGSLVSPPFGGEGNMVDEPRRVGLPYAGHTVTIHVDRAARVELWNGWWAQRVHFFLPPVGREPAPTRFEVDLSELPQVVGERLAVARRPAVAWPWDDGEPPPLPRTERPLRIGQNAPGIIAWGEVRAAPAAEQDHFFAAVAPYFDGLELPIAWTDWKADLWDRDPAARAHADAIAAAARAEIDRAAAHGLRIAVSLNFGESGPRCGKIETRRQPEFQGETFDPLTGTFARSPERYDWANPMAVEAARRAWRDAAQRIGPFDWLFFNEPVDRLQPWYEAPYFSAAALADFREFVGDPAARFPAKPYAAPSDRTDNQAGEADWERWRQWRLHIYARRIQALTEAVAEAQAGNPDYRGAIYFQHVGWAVPAYGVDLERIAAIPGISLLVAEYVTDARADAWRRFKYHAVRHRKALGSFVNLGYYDPDRPGRVRVEGTDESFRQAVQMGIDEGVAALTLYPVSAMVADDPGFHAARTAIWAELANAYAGR